MVDSLDDIAGVVSKLKCPCCGTDAQEGAFFCVQCGNSIDARFTASGWERDDSSSVALHRTTIVQKLVWALIVVTAAFGLYAIIGVRWWSVVVEKGTSDDSGRGAVAMAEQKLRNLQQSIAAEDERRAVREKAEQELFKQSLEETNPGESIFTRTAGCVVV